MYLSKPLQYSCQMERERERRKTAQNNSLTELSAWPLLFQMSPDPSVECAESQGPNLLGLMEWV